MAGSFSSRAHRIGYGARRALTALVASVMMLAGLVGVSAQGVAPVAAAPGGVIYDSIESPVPSNVPSLGFQATQTGEFGDKVTMASAGALGKARVLMSSWACQTGEWNLPGCVTTPGATYPVPITFHVYAPAGNTTGVGAELLKKTQTFNIPFRPSPDGVNCTGGNAGKWYDGTSCNNGLAHVVEFDLTSGTTPASPVVLPSTVIWTVSFNTQTYGAAPIGTAGPYNALNVGMLDGIGDTGSPTVGTDVDSDGVFWKTSTAGNYTDSGAAGVGVLRFDTNWTPYVPEAELEQLSLPTVSIGDVAVKEGNSGITIANVPVTLSHTYPAPVTVHYATAMGGATKVNARAKSGSDFIATAGNLTIPANTLSAVIPISVLGGTTLEQNEFFLVNLSLPTNAVLTMAQSGRVEIGNDELPQVRVKAKRVTEGSIASFRVYLKQTFWTTLTLNAATVGNTAASPGDFTAVNTTVSFPVETRGPQTVNVTTKTDNLKEAVESFYLQVTGGAAPAKAKAKINANNT